MTTIVEQFRDAIRGAGIEPPDVIESDGKLHRFSSNGKGGDDAGWYVLHDDGIPAGKFGDWRTSLVQSWRADIGRTLTSAEEAAHRSEVAGRRREREIDEARRRMEVRAKAAAIWGAAQPVEDHPYLRTRGIKSHGLRVHQGALVIPVRDTALVLHSLQFIGPEGEKRFLTGGRVKGCYFGVGKPNGILCIAEGYSTAASVHEVTGHAVAVAFSARNLGPVARALRDKFPEVRIVVCADNDIKAET
jgi:putative DNA primase/helicase